MSKDTQLKKEFQEKDLSRIRNIIEKRYDDSTGIQIGYSKEQKEYREGDIWEENGKTWTIKDGIRQTITKLDSFKKYSSYPLICPCCKNHFKLHELNKKMYNIHGKCSDCVIEMETQLKIEGKYEEYEKDLMNKNKNSVLDDFEQALDEYLNSPMDSFYTEDGQKESWQGGQVDKEHILKIKEEIKQQKLKSI